MNTTSEHPSPRAQASGQAEPLACHRADATSAPRRRRIAVVTMGVKLGDETRGYTRFRFLSDLLVREGFDVDLITSSFQHWDKAPRDTSKPCYAAYPFRVVFIDEPGYRKNLDLGRIMSHRVAAKNMRAHFDAAFSEDPHAYDLIYSEIPPNDVALACAESAKRYGIPYVADVNDLWPEAMRMVLDIPIVSDIAFYPFARDAKRTYGLISAAVGTSDEYALRPAKDRTEPYPHITVYVGNDIAAFDEGARAHAEAVEKPEGQIWVTYAGTIGASYDIETLVRAASLLETGRQKKQAKCAASRKDPFPEIRVKILGDGPDKERLTALAQELGAPVDFLGYTPYDLMAAYLKASDIVVNSLVKDAAQSIVTKIGDYLASGNPMINTGMSPEFRRKVVSDGFGLNVEPENERALAGAIAKLAGHASMRKIMGAKGRRIAECEFDQRRSYLKIVDLIRKLL